MKIAVLSDVHGNVPALQAVLDDIAQWQADTLIVTVIWSVAALQSGMSASGTGALSGGALYHRQS